jgi:hypothetical protein
MAGSGATPAAAPCKNATMTTRSSRTLYSRPIPVNEHFSECAVGDASTRADAIGRVLEDVSEYRFEGRLA